MIQYIEIKNYLSFMDASVNLQPFNLVVGANGSGKSNFLNLFADISRWQGLSRGQTIGSVNIDIQSKHHVNAEKGGVNILCRTCDQSATSVLIGLRDLLDHEVIPIRCKVFTLDPNTVQAEERIRPNIEMDETGAGVVSVLDSLKTGDREDLFDQIEESLIRYIPSIKKLSIRTTDDGNKALQVREHHLDEILPISALSEGTRLIILILTLIHQENPPDIICIEDVDRGMHPRLYQQLVETLQDITVQNKVQILATTQNPYLLDQFTGEEESVIIVEKKDGASTLTCLADRLKDTPDGKTEQGPLGEMWYGGFLGGVPSK